MTFYSCLPFDIPAESRQVVSEFITRVNYDSGIGNFEMDFDDGDVRYKTIIADATITTNLMATIVYNNVVVVDKYFASLLRVANGELSPTEAIALAEPKEEK